MIIEAADKMKNFEAGIFNILDDKKKNWRNRDEKFIIFLWERRILRRRNTS